MSTKTALVLVIGFIAGCGAAALAPLVIPSANAQTTTRWEVLCVDIADQRGTTIFQEANQIANRAGAEGWEPFSSDAVVLSSAHGSMCFKRPRQ